MFNSTISPSQYPILCRPLADTRSIQNTPSYTLNNQATLTLAGLFSGLIPTLKNIVIKHQFASQDGALERLTSAIGALRDGDGSGKGKYFQECKKVLGEILHDFGAQAGLTEEQCTACNHLLFTVIDEICQKLNDSDQAADNQRLDEFMRSYSGQLDEAMVPFSTLTENAAREKFGHLQTLEEFGVAADISPICRKELLGFFSTLNTRVKTRLVDEAIASASEPGIRFGIESDAIDVNQQVSVAMGKDNNFTASVSGMAAYYGYPKIAQILLEKGANAQLGLPALTIAAWKGHLDVVNVLLDNAPDLNLNHRYKEKFFFENCTALSMAALKGHLEIVEVLVKRGASPNASPDYGDRPALHSAMLHRQLQPQMRAALVNLLLEAPDIDVNFLFEGNPALCSAAMLCQTEIVDILSKHPDINPNIGKHSALIFATQNNSIDSVKSLLQIPGIDTTLTSYKETALMLALKRGYTEIVKLLRAHQNKPALPPLQNAITNG